MTAPIEHLPGCDLQHTSRQRCSTWIPGLQPVAELRVDRVTTGTARSTGQTTVWDRRLTWISVALILINAFWTGGWFAVEVRLDRTCEGDGCWVPALVVFVFWSLGEAILAPLTLWAIAFLLLRRVFGLNRRMAALISAMVSAPLAIASLLYVSFFWW